MASSYATEGEGTNGGGVLQESRRRRKDREELRRRHEGKEWPESIESSGSELVREWDEKQSMFATAAAASSFLRWALVTLTLISH